MTTETKFTRLLPDQKRVIGCVGSVAFFTLAADNRLMCPDIIRFPIHILMTRQTEFAAIQLLKIFPGWWIVKLMTTCTVTGDKGLVKTETSPFI